MAAGIVFSLLAAVLMNTGNLVEKHAVTSMPQFSARRSHHLVRALVTSPLWMIGFVLCLVGLVFQVMAFALAPIPVVQSIFNGGIVLLVMLSRLKLRERLNRAEWIGLGVVVASVTAVSVTLGGGRAVGLGGSGFEVIVAALPTLAIVAMIVVIMQTSQTSMGFLYGVTAGLLYGAASLGTKGASTLVVRDGVISSIPHILSSTYPYVFMAFSVMGMLIYQMGLQRFRIAVVGSMSDVTCSTYVVVVGTIVFGEHLPQDPVMLALRLGGFIGVLGGSVLVAWGGRTGTDEPTLITEADLGLGPVLVAEASSLVNHLVDDFAAGQRSQGSK